MKKKISPKKNFFVKFSTKEQPKWAILGYFLKKQAWNLVWGSRGVPNFFSYLKAYLLWSRKCYGYVLNRLKPLSNMQKYDCWSLVRNRQKSTFSPKIRISFDSETNFQTSLKSLFYEFNHQFLFSLPRKTMWLVMVCSDGESSISRYAGVGRQLLPDKPLKDIFKNAAIDNFLFLVCQIMNQNNHKDGQSVLWWWI